MWSVRAVVIAGLRWLLVNWLLLGWLLLLDCVPGAQCKVIEGRDLKPYAREILDVMTGYVELSPSGSGLHIWVKSREVFNRRTQGIEVYSDHRWMTVTGRANPRVPTGIPDRTEQVKQLIDERFPKPETAIFARPKAVEQDDAALWQRLFSTKNGNFLQALYDGDLSVVKDDHSRGVIMLANMLALYTHSDEARMHSLLAQTKLISDKRHEKRGNLTWIQFQVRDAIDFVHRRETARQRREQEEQEETAAKKESQSDHKKQSTKGSEETKKYLLLHLVIGLRNRLDARGRDGDEHSSSR